ncbi:cytidylate kinase family protein [bacterium]|nr:cytidylate kinase family protein [bacterium]
MKDNFIVTISGTPGSGKSTIAQALEKKFNAQRIYVGGIRRQIAKDKGMTLAELNKYALTHPETDVDVDKKAAKDARQSVKEKNVIVEGRPQFHFLPESIKLFIKVDIKEGAKRIWLSLQEPKNKGKRNEANVSNQAELEQKVIERNKNDWQRYKKYYDLDFTDESQYDFILDTTNINAQEATQKIIEFINSKI